MLCSNGLPAWCHALPRACPFLFPFDARRQLFHCTAFGVLRALHRLHGQARTAPGGLCGLRDAVLLLPRARASSPQLPTLPLRGVPPERPRLSAHLSARLSAHLSARGPQDGRLEGDGRELRVGRLQRQKVRVSRNRVFDSAAKVFQLPSAPKQARRAWAAAASAAPAARAATRQRSPRWRGRRLC